MEAATLADLLPQSVAVSPTTVVAGNVLTVSYTVRNQGGTNAPASHTRVQLKSAGGAILADQTFSTAAITANNFVNESRTFTIPTSTAAGSYNAFVIVDSQSEVTQSSTSNDGQNNAGVPFTVQTAASPTLSVSPSTRSVGSSASTTSFAVTNTGGGTFTYSATVTSGSWLSITSGSTGTNSGTISVAYSTNTGTQRTGTIVVSATGATGSPVTVTVTQSGTTTTIGVGSRIMASSDPTHVVTSDPINVRSSASTNTVLFQQTGGVHGTVTGGPTTGTVAPGNWWTINWDSEPPNQNGNQGWSAESVLALAPLAGDISQPNFSAQIYTSNNPFWTSGYAPGTSNPSNPWPVGAFGNCTWYAYGRMRELGYSAAQLQSFALGNAYQWAVDAQGSQATALGITFDTRPSVGSIAVRGKGTFSSLGHVAVVESVNADGTITITESSYSTDSANVWNFLWRHRTVDPSWFLQDAGGGFIHLTNGTSTQVSAPTPSAPSGGQTVSTLTPTLTWSGGSNFTSLQINLSKSPFGAANIVYTSAWLSSGTTSVTVSSGSLSLGTNYRWDVTACSGANGSGSCVTSGDAYFSTQAPSGAPSLYFGFDTSHIQNPGTINWSSVTSSQITFKGVNYPISFVIHRASKGNADVDNCRFLDPDFATRAASVPNGLAFGAYHVAAIRNTSAGESYTPESEAAYFVSVAGTWIKAGSMRPFLDVEDHSCATLSDPNIISKADLTIWIDKWMQEVERLTGIRPVIYTDSNFAGILQSLAVKYDLWIAKPGAYPDDAIAVPPWNVALVQYAWQSAIPNVTADMDVFQGTSASFQSRMIVPSSGNRTLNVTASPAAGGTVAGSGTFANGSSQTVTATPGAGYSFVNWTEGGIVASTSTSYTFTLTTNRTLVANFSSSSVNYTVSATASPGNGGVASGGGVFPTGSSVTVTAAPASGYTFVNWTENGNPVSTSASYTFALTTGRILVANFAAAQTNYSVSASPSPPAGGTITGAGTFAPGSTVTLTGLPAAGYSFLNWTENGVVVGTLSTYTFTINSNRTLIANFSFTQTSGPVYGSDYISFEGTGVVLDSPTSTLCQNSGINSGNTYNIVYRFSANPSVIADALSFIRNGNSVARMISTQSPSFSLNGSQSVTWTIINNHADLQGPILAGISTMTIQSGANAPVALGTGNVKIVNGQINNFLGISGCNINNFHAAAAAIPN